MTRIAKPRSFHQTLVIVCEDSHTAPNYLFHLKKQAIDTGCWDYIEISPKPPIETIIPTQQENTHKTKRPKRKFLDIVENDGIDVILENENNEQPVRYVRTVQKALQEGYSEGWAVYDLDGHSGHQRAAEMARETPNLHIAFSSRSIEIWFLLHFEQISDVFSKVHCKTEKGKVLNCNTNNQCIDEECLVGYIRRNTPLANYAKNTDLFSEINPYVRNAITNSEWIRTQYSVESPFYTRNPYSTMDKLVKRLLKWVSVGDNFQLNGFQIEVISTSPTIELQMQNISKGRQVIQKEHFAFEDNTAFEIEMNGNGIIEMDESRRINISVGIKEETKLKYPANNEQNYIWILC
ncbi:RloB family protein [Flectobacillus longus]|uniref:RloB family protein n=1 Tax=Flectobacillus longus TaxID=2984207 RepID=UPI0024B78A06|nr:RloB family protein [Flectobacillus longus]MDI9879251.1 RloB family protein [Flectobacillus longus]